MNHTTSFNESINVISQNNTDIFSTQTPESNSFDYISFTIFLALSPFFVLILLFFHSIFMIILSTRNDNDSLSDDTEMDLVHAPIPDVACQQNFPRDVPDLIVGLE